MNEAKEEKTAEQILALYPALTKLLAYISGIEKTAIVLAMEEYTHDQLSKEQENRREELKQAFNAGRNYQRGEMGVWHGAPDHDYPDFKEWYESLIAKASELDKNN